MLNLLRFFTYRVLLFNMSKLLARNIAGNQRPCMIFVPQSLKNSYTNLFLPEEQIPYPSDSSPNGPGELRIKGMKAPCAFIPFIRILLPSPFGRGVGGEGFRQVPTSEAVPIVQPLSSLDRIPPAG